eukprot:894195-Prorocentrum_minimum.AAC.1
MTRSTSPPPWQAAACRSSVRSTSTSDAPLGGAVAADPTVGATCGSAASARASAREEGPSP